MIAQNLLDAYAAAIEADYIRYSGGTSVSGPIKITFEPGKRWIRVVRSQHANRSSHSFIEATTGDIYKCASWSTPAKGVRGSVYNLTPRVTEWTSAK